MSLTETQDGVVNLLDQSLNLSINLTRTVKIIKCTIFPTVRGSSCYHPQLEAQPDRRESNRPYTRWRKGQGLLRLLQVDCVKGFQHLRIKLLTLRGQLFSFVRR